MFRDNVSVYAEWPTERCPGCPITSPNAPTGDIENIACLANTQLRRNAGLPIIPCGLIEMQYCVDVNTTPGVRESTIARVSILPPGGVDAVVLHESSKHQDGYIVDVALEGAIGVDKN